VEETEPRKLAQSQSELTLAALMGVFIQREFGVRYVRILRGFLAPTPSQTAGFGRLTF